MWIIKKTKQTLKRDIQPHNQTDQFKLIDQLCSTDGNVLSIPKLQQLSSYTFDLQKCQMIFEILDNKLNRYTHKKNKVDKLFKILVVIDYVLLNGAAAMIDLFKDNLEAFQRLSQGKEGKEQQTGMKDNQFREMVISKSSHVVMILSDKQKRLQEKLRLNQAKLLLKGERISIDNNMGNTQVIAGQDMQILNQAIQPSSSFFKKRPQVFVKFQKYMEKKLIKLSSALLGLIDPDYEISDDYLKNKQFMQRGESIIDQVQEQNKESILKENEQQNTKKLDQEVKKMEQQAKKNQNLLDLPVDFI